MSRSDTPKEEVPRILHSYSSRDDIPYVVDWSEQAAQGSIARVRKVTCKSTGRSLAEKTFEKVISSRDREAILKELGILQKCDHTNIVTLIEAYEVVDEPRISIVMSPWAPYTLDVFLYDPYATRKGMCPWFNPGDGQSAVVFSQVMLKLAEAIDYLHKKSIKHKDIKPTNILLQTSQRGVKPYVADVGVSKEYIEGQTTEYTNSTREFLAPEQIKHKKSSLKADIWQLGCCFAMILALACGGTRAVYSLHVSYNKTDEKCSCIIAKQYESFTQELEIILKEGSAALQYGHRIVKRMLEMNHERRIDIGTVVTELEQFAKMAVGEANLVAGMSDMEMV